MFKPEVTIYPGMTWAIQLGYQSMNKKPHWAVYGGSIVQGFCHGQEFFFRSPFHNNQWVSLSPCEINVYFKIEGAERQQKYQIREMARAQAEVTS